MRLHNHQRRRRSSLIALAMVTSLIALPTQAVAAAAADGPVAASGRFVAEAARLLDTRPQAPPNQSLYQYQTPMLANTWRTVQVSGRAGVPSTGLSAVSVTITAVNPSAAGLVDAAASDASNPEPLSYLNYLANVTSSNSAVLALSPAGAIKVRTSTSVDVVIDIQGYYTTGSSTGGGFTPVRPTRVADSRYGQGLSGSLPSGSPVVLQSLGPSIPSNATSVVVNVSTINPTSNGHLQVAATNESFSSAAYTFRSNAVTAIGLTTEVGLNGQGIKFQSSAGQPNLTVDVVGYFTPAADGHSFSAGRGRVIDTRDLNIPVGANETGSS